MSTTTIERKKLAMNNLTNRSPFLCWTVEKTSLNLTDYRISLTPFLHWCIALPIIVTIIILMWFKLNQRTTKLRNWRYVSIPYLLILRKVDQKFSFLLIKCVVINKYTATAFSNPCLFQTIFHLFWKFPWRRHYLVIDRFSYSQATIIMYRKKIRNGYNCSNRH